MVSMVNMKIFSDLLRQVCVVMMSPMHKSANLKHNDYFKTKQQIVNIQLKSILLNHIFLNCLMVKIVKDLWIENINFYLPVSSDRHQWTHPTF